MDDRNVVLDRIYPPPWFKVARNVSQKLATKLVVECHEEELEVILLFIPP